MSHEQIDADWSEVRKAVAAFKEAWAEAAPKIQAAFSEIAAALKPLPEGAETGRGRYCQSCGVEPDLTALETDETKDLWFEIHNRVKHGAVL